MEFLEEKISGNTEYKGYIVDVKVDKVRLSDGRQSTREVVLHPGGVAIIPVDEQGEVTCVRQYRYPLSKSVLEVPAGKLEWGEAHYECAVRELKEETGYKAKELVYLGGCATSPGYSTELLHVYLAMGLEQGEMCLDEGELLSVEKHSLDSLKTMVMQGEIEDAKTIVAVLKASEYLKK